MPVKLSFDIAASKGYDEMVIALAELRSPLDVPTDNSAKRSPLFLATYNGKLSTIQTLVRLRLQQLTRRFMCT